MTVDEMDIQEVEKVTDNGECRMTVNKPSSELLSLYNSAMDHEKNFQETWLQLKIKAQEEGFSEEEIGRQKLEWVINEGNCVFIDCKGKATGWIYNIDCSVEGGAPQMLHACKEHVEKLQCDDEERKEMFGI
jgi:hypothetical protein